MIVTAGALIHSQLFHCKAIPLFKCCLRVTNAVIQPLDTICQLSCFHSPNGNKRLETVAPPPSQQRHDVAHSPRRRWGDGRVEEVSWGAKVHRLLVWKTYDSAAQSHQTDLSTSLTHNLSVRRLKSRPCRRRRVAESTLLQRRSLTQSPGDTGSDGRERRNWVDINRLATASLPP